VFALIVASQAMAQDRMASYPSMAPIGQYLMADRDAEIALARSAAPNSISRDATVLVLTAHGYETATEGENGFTCLVERSWMSPFDSPEFWNPSIRGPICYNPPAVRSILSFTFYRTKLVLAGISKGQMLKDVRSACARKALPVPELGSMSYMMSKQAYLGDTVRNWHSHLMFHVPKTDGSNWGANLPGSPVLLNAEFTEVPEQETIFMVPVGRWSDGTVVEKHEHISEAGQRR
jgi:hypothetical protein